MIRPILASTGATKTSTVPGIIHTVARLIISAFNARTMIRYRLSAQIRQAQCASLLTPPGSTNVSSAHPRSPLAAPEIESATLNLVCFLSTCPVPRPWLVSDRFSHRWLCLALGQEPVCHVCKTATARATREEASATWIRAPQLTTCACRAWRPVEDARPDKYARSMASTGTPACLALTRTAAQTVFVTPHRTFASPVSRTALAARILPRFAS